MDLFMFEPLLNDFESAVVYLVVAASLLGRRAKFINIL